MSRFAITNFALLLVVGIGVAYLLLPVKKVALSKLEQRDGIYYLGTEDVAFSGVALEEYPSGSIKSSTRYEAGKPHGESLGYYENGQIQVREVFRDGVSHGTRTKWYTDGVKQSEGRIVGGEFDGLFSRWDEEGRLLMEVELKSGVPHGTSRSWYTGGALKSEVVMENGREISRQEFEDETL